MLFTDLSLHLISTAFTFNRGGEQNLKENNTWFQTCLTLISIRFLLCYKKSEGIFSFVLLNYYLKDAGKEHTGESGNFCLSLFLYTLYLLTQSKYLQFKKV